MKFKHLPFLLLIFALAACGRTTEEPFIPTQFAPPQPSLTPIPTTTPDILAGNNPSTRFETLVREWGDPAQGEILFNTHQDAVGFACATCHNHQNEERKIGPGLFNLAERTTTRVADQSPELYIFNSIIQPDAYVVEDYDENLMPKNYWDIYSTAEISHITAYLLTLEGEPPGSADDVGAAVSIIALPNTADAAQGEELFNTHQVDAGFACATCHHVDTEDRLIGPGLLNVGSRAETRVEGQNKLEYIFTSIINPDAYVVEGFDDNLMPENWREIYSEEEIYDIMAYLLTLSGAQDTNQPPSVDTATVPSDIPVALLESADPANGMALFTTFQVDAGFACSTCHRTNTEDRLIGPGHLNIGSRAETRVEEQSAVEYIYTSIVNPDAYIVPDFPDDLMPENWAAIYSDEEIFDIIAYMLTLGDGGSAATPAEDTESDESNSTQGTGSVVEPPADLLAKLEAADAEKGMTLYTTFQSDVGFACSTCHLADSEDRLIGPGLLNIASTAETRIEGMSGLKYLYQSMIAPNDFLVIDYPGELMPEWSAVYTEEEIFDIIAYLLTLGQ